MMTRHGRTTSWLAGSLILAITAGTAVPARGADNEVKKLRQERVTVLREVVDMTMKMYERGSLVWSEVEAAQRRLLEAELELAEPGPDRVAIWERALVAAKREEEQANVRYKAGMGSAVEQKLATAYRLQVQIGLAVEKGRK